MANIRSLFTGGTGSGAGSSGSRLDPDLAALPPPPSTREMLDDIERCDDNDPVMLFAKQLKKEIRRNSRSQPGGGGGGDRVAAEYDEEFSSASEGEEEIEEGDDDDNTAESPKRNRAPKIKFPDLSTANSNFMANVNQASLSSYPRNFSQEQIMHANATYNRLRALCGLFQDSETLLEEIEPKFKRLDAESKEFVESCRKVLEDEDDGENEIQNENEDEDNQDESLL